MRHISNDVVYNENDPFGCYYYKDYHVAKVRIIVLNSSDIYEPDGTLQYRYLANTVFHQEQISWFANHALDFSDKDDPSDWLAIICTHTFNMFGGIYRIINAARNGSSVNATWNIGDRMVYDSVYENYKNDPEHTLGQVQISVNKDYSEQGNINVVVFRGHDHNDVLQDKNGTKVLEFACDNVRLYDLYTMDIPNGISAGNYYFVTEGEHKFGFTLTEDYLDARKVGFNHYFAYADYCEAYIIGSNNENLLKMNAQAIDTTTGYTELTGFEIAHSTDAEGRSVLVVSINKDNGTISTEPLGIGPRRTFNY